MDSTSQDGKLVYDYYDYINSYAYDLIQYGCYWHNTAYTLYVATLVIASIGLPLILVAIFAIYSLVRRDHVAPVYVINLLITDLIQVCCMIALTQLGDYTACSVFLYILHFGMMVSISFMMVVSLERYLVAVFPVWYQRRRNIKTSVVVCVVVWVFPFLYLPIFFFVHHRVVEIIIGAFLLLPFPLLIFFLAGTVKALSADNGVPSDEKRRVVAIQVLVLLIYTFLFLPRVVFSLGERYRHYPTFEILTIVPVHFSPLADLFLYVFMRKGIVDRLLASLCPCRTDNDDISISTVNDENAAAVSSAQEESKEVEKVNGDVDV